MKRWSDEKEPEKMRLCELIGVFPGKKRMYIGGIVRDEENHTSFCRGEVIIEEGIVYAIGENEAALQKAMNEICKLNLDHGLHNKNAPGRIILGSLCCIQ